MWRMPSERPFRTAMPSATIKAPATPRPSLIFVQRLNIPRPPHSLRDQIGCEGAGDDDQHDAERALPRARALGSSTGPGEHRARAGQHLGLGDHIGDAFALGLSLEVWRFGVLARPGIAPSPFRAGVDVDEVLLG